MAYEYNLNPEAEELRNRTEEEAAMPLPEEAGGEIPPQAAPQQDAQAPQTPDAAAVQEREADRRRLMETYRQMRGEPLASSKMLGDMARYGYRCDEDTVLPDGSRRLHFGFGHDANDVSRELRRSEERIEVLGRELEAQAKETEEIRAELEWLRTERVKLSQNYAALAALEAKERQQLRRIRALLEDPLVVINTDDERKLRPVKNTSRQEVYHTLVKVQSVLGLTRLWTEAAGNGG